MFIKKILPSALLLLTSLSLFSATINILYFNDFHGNVNDTAKTPGMIKFASYIDNFKKGHPNTLVFSGGDNYQGTMISNTTNGTVVNKMFKLIGVNASAVGNHEFDWGVKNFPLWEKQGNFTYLAANIINKKTGKTVSWLTPYKIYDIEKCKIAVIGLATTDTVNTTLKDNLKGLKFEEPETALKNYIQTISTLPTDQKPDLYIALTHIPAEVNNENKIIGDDEMLGLLKSSKQIRILLSAHNHKIVNTEYDNTLILEAGCQGEELANITIDFDEKNHKVRHIKTEMIDMLKVSPKPLNKEAESIYNFYKDKLSKISQKVIGTCTGDIPNEAEKYHLTPMGATACKAIQEEFNVQVAMLNQWGIRNDLKKGKLTWGDLYSVFPFDNTVVVVQITGEDLKAQIEHSITLQGGAFYGVKALYDKSKPAGERISNMQLMDGTPVLSSKYYSVAINNFMYTGGDHYSFENAKSVDNTQQLLRGSLKKYILKNKKLTPVSTNYLIVK